MSEENIKMEEDSEKEFNTSDLETDNKEDSISGSTDNEESGTAKDADTKKSSKGKMFGRKTKSKDSRLEEVQNELAELKDKHLRLFSEFDNYRKRTQREKADLLKMASAELITALIPVLDDFERANKSMETAKDVQSLKDGVELIYNKFRNLLIQKGLEPMDSMGKEFDTDMHEAITNIPAPQEEMKGKVVDVIEKGYTLQGKVLRFAKVVVGS